MIQLDGWWCPKCRCWNGLEKNRQTCRSCDRDALLAYLNALHAIAKTMGLPADPAPPEIAIPRQVAEKMVEYKALEVALIRIRDANSSELECDAAEWAAEALAGRELHLTNDERRAREVPPHDPGGRMRLGDIVKRGNLECVVAKCVNPSTACLACDRLGYHLQPACPTCATVGVDTRSHRLLFGTCEDGKTHYRECPVGVRAERWQTLCHEAGRPYNPAGARNMECAKPVDGYPCAQRYGHTGECKPRCARCYGTKLVTAGNGESVDCPECREPIFTVAGADGRVVPKE